MSAADSASPIRVLLVDDQALVRSGFRIILESEPDLVVVGEAATGAEAVALAATLRPDVICMDVEMPVMDGIVATRQILTSAAGEPAPGSAGTSVPTATGPAVLILTTFGHDRYLFDALAAGASGFLLKTSRAEQLIDAVRQLAAGNALLGPDVTHAVLARVAGTDRGAHTPTVHAPTASTRDAQDLAEEPRAPEAPQPPSGAGGAAGPGAAALDAAGLTDREREVLALVAEGRSNAEIAAKLFLGESTIKTHVSNVLQKLGVRDRIQAVVWAHTRGAV